MSYFPMFVELQSRKCLVVGGGRMALHKVRVLREFGASIYLVAPEILDEIKEMADVVWKERPFCPADVSGMKLVVAATGDKEQNHQVAHICRQQKIPVNAVDQIEDCSFLFPSYLKQGEVVAAFSSGGQSPVVTQYLKERARPFVTGHLGRMAAFLGDLRKTVKKCVGRQEKRKYVYRELLQRGLEREELPAEEEVQSVIQKYREEV